MCIKPNPARQAYLKQWRKDHPEAIRRYNEKYWERRLKREKLQLKEERKHGGKEIQNS